MTTVKDRALVVADRLGVALIPRLPAAAKRLMSGGRTIIDGNTLDPSLQMMLAAQRAIGVDGLTVVGDPHATRVKNRVRTATLNQPEKHVAQIRTLSIPGPAGDIPVRHYRPQAPAVRAGQPVPLLVFYHGGGFVFGDLETHDGACRLICRDAGVQVLAVDYRLAPEHPAPAAVDDAYAAYRWAREHANDLGADPGRVAVGGDSAGGCLAAVVTRLARDAGDPLPSLQWLVYPVTDLRGGTRSREILGSGFLLTRRDIDWFERAYLGASQLSASDPLVSPLVVDDFSGLSPALVITAGFDPLRDEGESYAVRLQEAGVVVDMRRMPAMIHSFLNLNALGGGVRDANAEMISALRAHLAYD